MKEDYVSFEIAKLLKEKGFNEYVEWAYRYFAENNICVIHINEKPASTLIENCYPYVTLQMAMKWLRERYKLNIIISVDDLDWFYSIIDYTHKDDVKLLKDLAGFNSYESACEAAIIECLTNLI